MKTTQKMKRMTKKNEVAADAWPAPPEWAKLVTYTVYFSPVDFHGKYVVRRWYAKKGEPVPVADVVPRLADDYNGVLRLIPAGLLRTARHEQDDPSILETWL